MASGSYMTPIYSRSQRNPCRKVSFSRAPAGMDLKDETFHILEKYPVIHRIRLGIQTDWLSYFLQIN
ncbi:hypothetical protein TNCV_3165831 [Trichonephila clavipes]|uniref:Uncharacterized protein n=1 Tax=Trichonephila clavipes TaxID=2585209 RepID=A0A8X6V0H9_TRICX|nr:hypothetical protein TNCV_3165831 [Trichonephila clavipes]